MKKLIIAPIVALTLCATTATAGGMAEPAETPKITMAEPGSAATAYIVHLLLLAFIAAANS